MAKFRFVYWLLEFLKSKEGFIFEWDDGNISKSEDKHGVTIDMVESCFDDVDLLAIGEQYSPVVNEERYGVIGRSLSNDVFFICFTIRRGVIRPISARLANKKERRVYEEAS